jgi:hypothetical protein
MEADTTRGGRRIKQEDLPTPSKQGPTKIQYSERRRSALATHPQRFRRCELCKVELDVSNTGPESRAVCSW